MNPPPPPPPPHGSSSNKSGLPPGNYDIFIIPPHSSGSGFLYLPSLQTNRNSFLAGVGCTLVAVGIWTVVFPVLREWFATLVASGGMAVVVLLIGVGVAGWAWGKTQTETGGPTSGGATGASANPNGHPTGTSQPQPPPPPPPPQPEPQQAPDPEPQQRAPPPKPTWQRAQTGPAGGGGTAHAGGTSYTAGTSTGGAGNTGSAKGTWEKAREETRKKEEERKRAEELRKKREELEQERVKQREKDALERLLRERREKREQELKEKAAAAAAAAAAPPPPRPTAPKPETSRPPSPTKRHQQPTARTATEDDAYSFRPYDKPKRTAHTASSIYSESSYAPSQSTSRTTPPPSHRGPYHSKDPDKIVLKAVYSFNNTFTKLPLAQLISGKGSVTDGLILRITTEGLFIDDDVRGVPQREWDIKAWTLKLVEVWCPQLHALGASSGSNSTPAAGRTGKSGFLFSNKEKGASKVPSTEESDQFVTHLMSACKSPSNPASYRTASSETSSNTGASQTGESKGLHVLRANIRDQEGKRYVFVLQEEEGWKVAVGLQRLRRGTQVRALGVSGMAANEAKVILDSMGWGR
ncbi:MAG: hypothetical protein Q9221_000310 [Calogaya cf. arnoldii]